MEFILILILFSILIINYLINSHILFFAVSKKIRKEFTDSIFIRFLCSVYTIFVCLKLKKYKEIRYAFSLLDYKIFLQRISFKRILYLTKVRYKILFLILWIFYFLDIILIPIILFKLNNFDFYIKNILLFQEYLWLIETFFLVFFQKNKKTK